MKRKDIHDILHPTSIAVVGVSNDQAKGATLFLSSLLEIGYEGQLYPVNPSVKEAMGRKTYPSLLAIPGRVDHVIVGVPARIAPSIVQEAVAKGVQSIHFFTSGFAEVGTDEGRTLQKAISDIARGKVRIIGPNCMGIYNPKAKIAFDGGQLPIAGGAAFVSQSGGLATYFARNAIQEGNYCSKVVSIGNSSDLRITDFFEYFSEDDDTETISMYIEGMADGEGRKLLNILEETTGRKPVLIWKGGQSDQGARTAFSHTGAMATSYGLWQTVVRQCGAILVDNVEEMQDFIKLHRLSSPSKGTRSCLVTFGGGNSVAYSDICAKEGILLPELEEKTQAALVEFIPPMGTIRNNPVDMSAAGWVPGVIERSLMNVAKDPNIDSIVFVTQIGFVAGANAERFGMDPKVILDFQVREVVSASQRLDIPLVCVNPVPFEDLALEELRLYVKREFEKNNIATFLSMERAARALKRRHDYDRFVDKVKAMHVQ
ncbi:MAG: CoA-binding protein [Deltaproteobacteria bacterium]|nr:CoA-binding protein [Deltaproteobacteria bacterium]